MHIAAERIVLYERASCRAPIGAHAIPSIRSARTAAHQRPLYTSLYGTQATRKILTQLYIDIETSHATRATLRGLIYYITL